MPDGVFVCNLEWREDIGFQNGGTVGDEGSTCERLLVIWHLGI